MGTPEFVARQSEVQVAWGPLECMADLSSENSLVEEFALNLCDLC